MSQLIVYQEYSGIIHLRGQAGVVKKKLRRIYITNFGTSNSFFAVSKARARLHSALFGDSAEKSKNEGCRLWIRAQNTNPFLKH
jgi:hypothetical protein